MIRLNWACQTVHPKPEIFNSRWAPRRGLCAAGIHRRSKKLARGSVVSHTWSRSKDHSRRREPQLVFLNRVNVHKGLDRNAKVCRLDWAVVVTTVLNSNERLVDDAQSPGSSTSKRQYVGKSQPLVSGGQGLLRTPRYVKSTEFEHVSGLGGGGSRQDVAIVNNNCQRPDVDCSKRHSITRNPVSQLLASPDRKSNDAEFGRFPSRVRLSQSTLRG
jgi:hypothetical protein